MERRGTAVPAPLHAAPCSKAGREAAPGALLPFRPVPAGGPVRFLGVVPESQLPLRLFGEPALSGEGHDLLEVAIESPGGGDAEPPSGKRARVAEVVDDTERHVYEGA